MICALSDFSRQKRTNRKIRAEPSDLFLRNLGVLRDECVFGFYAGCIESTTSFALLHQLKQFIVIDFERSTGAAPNALNDLRHDADRQLFWGLCANVQAHRRVNLFDLVDWHAALQQVAKDHHILVPAAKKTDVARLCL